MARSEIRILFWNARSIRLREEDLPNLLSSVDVFVGVETWLSERDAFHLPGFKVSRKNRSLGPGGGIIFLIRNGISFTEIHNLKDANNKVEMHGIVVTNYTPEVSIIGCYRAPANTLTQAEWDCIAQNTQINQHCLLMGDFNAHHQSWNCRSNDTGGNRFLNSIDIFDLMVNNPKTLTRVDFTTGRASNIDLIISSVDLVDKIETSTLDETYGSDHYPLLTSLLTNKKTVYSKKSFKIYSKHTDCERVNETLDASYNYFLGLEYCNSTPSEKYKQIVEQIKSAVRSCTPRNKAKEIKYQHRNPVS